MFEYEKPNETELAEEAAAAGRGELTSFADLLDCAHNVFAEFTPAWTTEEVCSPLIRLQV